MSLQRMHNLGRRTFLLFSAFSLVLFASSSAVAIPADLDADGLDEIILVNIDKGDRIDWSVLSSSSGYQQESSSQQNLGELGVHLIPNFYLSSDLLSLGYAELNEAGQVEWRILNAEGEEQVFTQGVKQDFLISGADYNADGLGDVVTVNMKGQIFVTTSPFSSEPALQTGRISRKGIKRARKSGRGAVSFLPASGGNAPVIYSVYKKGKKRRSRYALNFSNGSRLNIRSRSNGSILSTMPIQRPDGSYAILIVESTNSGAGRFRIFDLAGTELYDNEFGGTGATIGNFVAAETNIGQQFAVQIDDSVLVVSPFGDQSAQEINIGSGILVDLINVNSFGLVVNDPSTGGDGNSGGGGGGGTPSGGETPTGPLASVCSKVFPIELGALWKTASDVNDSRGGLPAFLVNGVYSTTKRSIPIYDAIGNLICDAMTFKASDIPGINSGALHFYAGWLNACFLSARQMRAAAVSGAGSPAIYLQWKGTQCLVVQDANRREGGIP